MVARLRGHDWGADPFERAQEGWRIRTVEGRCFFLDAQNRCRIQVELSYDQKPEVCRAFPLTVLDVGGRRHARLSFWCPTVASNTGKPLEHQTRWIRETARRADRRTAPITLDGAAELTPREFERIDAVLRQFLAASDLPVRERLAAGAALLNRLSTAQDAGRGTLLAAVQAAERAGPAGFAAETRTAADEGAGRRLLALYLLQDGKRGRIATLARAATVFLFWTGVVKLSSRAVEASARWPAVRDVTFEASDDGREVLTRYLVSKLDSRRYVAGDASLLEGFNLLVAAYAVISLLARLRAAAEGRTACSADDVQRAAGAADLLVVEHVGHSGNRFYRQIVHDALNARGLCGDLLARVDAR